MKAVRSINLQTARRLLNKEGFFYEHFKKGGYVDGHERPDVVAYQNSRFLPAMLKHSERLVQYVIGDVETELVKLHTNYVEHRLVLLSHDEAVTQSNDSVVMEWVLDKRHKLRKKGNGHGIQHSDVVCSTMGWLEDAGEQLEYGKNHKGYWTGEHFVNQVRSLSHFFCAY